MTYKTIANHIGGTVTPNTVAKHLKSLNGFSVAKTRILPQLTKGFMKNDYSFANLFLFSGIQQSVLNQVSS